MTSEFNFLNVDRHERKKQGLLMGFWEKTFPGHIACGCSENGGFS